MHWIFGVSYLRAQQKADQVLMAEERCRKVIQNVLQDAQQLLACCRGTKTAAACRWFAERVNTALERAKAIEKQGIMPQAQVLGYQRALLDAVSTLTLRRQDLELARAPSCVGSGCRSSRGWNLLWPNKTNWPCRVSRWMWRSWSAWLWKNVQKLWKSGTASA